MNATMHEEITVDQALEEMTKQCNEAVDNFRKISGAQKPIIQW